MPAVVHQQVFTFKPSSYTANEQRTLFSIRDSYFRVISCDVRIQTAFNGSPALQVGTVATPSQFATSGEISIGSVGVYEGGGSGLLAPGTAVIADYTGHASTTAGLARITLTGFRVGV
jgi:hypothetical protein